MDASPADDLVSSCLAAEKRCANHPYGSKAGALLLFELSRSVQSKVLAAREKTFQRAQEMQKLREFRDCWESLFGATTRHGERVQISQGELGVVPMTPEAALGHIRSQEAAITSLKHDLERERKANDEAVSALQSTLEAHQESSRRALKLGSERMARHIEVRQRGS
jgi:hypothetical protein